MTNSNPFGKITLGSDPEIFVTKDGMPWGAIHSGIKGTKENPLAVEKGAIQVDGMALEFNIEPAATVEEWVHNHEVVMQQITTIAGDKGLVYNTASMLDFTNYIDTQNPTEEETIFGCDPDYCADTMQENKMPENTDEIKFRTTGGHVHIGMEGWEHLHGGDNKIKHLMAQRIVYVCDLVLGLWSVLEDDGIERKKLYGKAGAYRIKPYGVEYRTLSNFWIFDKEKMEFVFNTLTAILSDLELFTEAYTFANDNRKSIVYAINTNDKKLAKTIIEDAQNKL